MQKDADHMQTYSVHQHLQRKPTILLSVVGMGEVQVRVPAFEFAERCCEASL